MAMAVATAVAMPDPAAAPASRCLSPSPRLLHTIPACVPSLRIHSNHHSFAFAYTSSPSSSSSSSSPASCSYSPFSSSLRRSFLLGSVAAGSCVNVNPSGAEEPPPLVHGDPLRTESALDPIQKDSVHPPTFVSAPNRRIVAVGDLHGDIDQTRKALSLAGLLSSDGLDTWVGGSDVLVQVGDVLDRGGDEIAILSLLRWLNIQAEPKGGAVFQVNGNHETINVEGDFRYVDPSCYYEMCRFMEFCEEEYKGDYEAAFVKWRAVSGKLKSAKLLSYDWMPWNLVQMQKGMSARSFLFSPGGPLAKELSRHGVVLKVNDWLFAHGGVHPHHVEYGLQRINKEVSEWMIGAQNGLGQPAEVPFVATRGFDSVVWSRFYSREAYEKQQEAIQVCAVLKAVLDAVGAKALIVGHTPQTLGANSKCQGQVWRIDVGMSSGMWSTQPEVLEIVGDQVKVLGNTLQPSNDTDEDKSA